MAALTWISLNASKRPIEQVPIDSWKPGYRTIGIYRRKCCVRVDLGLRLNEVRKRPDFIS